MQFFMEKPTIFRKKWLVWLKSVRRNWSRHNVEQQQCTELLSVEKGKYRGMEMHMHQQNGYSYIKVLGNFGIDKHRQSPNIREWKHTFDLNCVVGAVVSVDGGDNQRRCQSCESRLLGVFGTTTDGDEGRISEIPL